MRSNVLSKALTLAFCSYAAALNAQTAADATATASSQSVPFNKANFQGKSKELGKAIADLKAGDEFFRQYEYNFLERANHDPDKALAYFEKAAAFNPDNASLNFKMGLCYFYSAVKSKKDCLPFFQKAFDLDNNVDPQIRSYLGQALHLNAEWDKAIEHYNAYKGTIPAKAPLTEGKFIDKKVQECNTGKELAAKPIRVSKEAWGGSSINTAYPETSLAISDDGKTMMFTARKDNTTSGKKDYFDLYHFEDIYKADKGEGNAWSSSQLAGVNTAYHDAVLDISADGKKMLIYKGDNQGDIYEVEKVGDGENWGEPKALPKTINTKHHESSASYSLDGKAIYFTSNRPDKSKGGLDVFMSTRDEAGSYGEPTSVDGVNTEYDEDAVSLGPDGETLYYVSNGDKSLGGFDVMKAKKSGESFVEPANMGFPLNTPDDDVFFAMLAGGRSGILSSELAADKGGLGKTDFIEIKLLGPDKPVIATTKDDLMDNLLAEAMDKAKKDAEPTIEAFRNVLFDYDKYNLRPDAIVELERVYEFLMKYPDLKITVSGYTDPRGSNEYNKKLSKKRADAVRNYLVKKGIAGDRVKAEHYGESNLVSKDKKEESMQQDRRAEFKTEENKK